MISPQPGCDDPLDTKFAKKALRKLEVQISSRKSYLREQERLISYALEEGNIQLRSLKYQIEHLEAMKLGVAQELADLNIEKSLLIDEIGRLQIHSAQTLYDL